MKEYEILRKNSNIAFSLLGVSILSNMFIVTSKLTLAISISLSLFLMVLDFILIFIEKKLKVSSSFINKKRLVCYMCAFVGILAFSIGLSRPLEREYSYIINQALVEGSYATCFFTALGYLKPKINIQKTKKEL